ncbi:MAG: FxsA family protein [Nitriliruptorales bacterium]|nr:FxsA family protein [Nitriliruptorales bacterium]
MAWLVLAFILVPILELAVIIEVDGVLGLGPTIALLVLDSLVGAWLVRREGVRAWRRFRTALDERRWPGDEVTQGGLVLMGGALLLTPGFVTDGVGLLMVAPPTRALLSRAIRARLRSASPWPFGSESAGRQEGQGRGTGQPRQDVLDVEVVSVERDDDPDADPPRDGEDSNEG